MKITMKFVWPYERDNWWLSGWWLSGVRYGFRVLGVEVNAEVN